MTEKDENNDGYIDKEEFTEALHDIDNGILNDEIEEIFNNLTKNNEYGFAEMSIEKFIKYVRNQQIERMNNKNDNIKNAMKQKRTYSLPSVSIKINKPSLRNNMSLKAIRRKPETPKTVLRTAFSGIFGDSDDDENRDVWGSDKV